MKVPNWPQKYPEQLAETLRRIESACNDPRVLACVRIIAVRSDEGRWHAAFGRVDLCRDGDMLDGPRYSYVDTRVLAERLPGSAFLGRFRPVLAGEGPVTIGDVSIEPFPTNSGWDADGHRSHSDYAEWPCVRLSRPLPPGRAEGPFASAHGHPYYARIEELIGDVGTFATFHGSRDSRCSSLQVIFWQHEGRVVEVALSDGGAPLVKLAGDDLSALTVAGRISTSEADHQFSAPAAPSVVLPEVAMGQRVELALVRSDNTIVDAYEADAAPQVKAVAAKTRSLEDAVARALMQGEGAGVEFKPYVRPKEPKWEEILETALAMANANGGMILIGIDDHGAPRFGAEEAKIVSDGKGFVLPSDAEEGRASALHSAVVKYGNSSRDRIQRIANRSLLIACRICWLGPCPCLVVSIRKGKDPPYMDTRNNNIWYRTNATNRRPSETELAVMFGEPGNGE